MDNGVFVLEAQVSHFTDYALKHRFLTSPACSLEVGEGQAEIFEVKKLPRNVSLFVNKGDKTIMVFYWRRPTERFYTSRAEGSVGAAHVGVSAAIDRAKLDTPTDRCTPRSFPRVSLKPSTSQTQHRSKSYGQRSKSTVIIDR